MADSYMDARAEAANAIADAIGLKASDISRLSFVFEQDGSVVIEATHIAHPAKLGALAGAVRRFVAFPFEEVTNGEE